MSFALGLPTSEFLGDNIACWRLRTAGCVAGENTDLEVLLFYR